MNTLDDYLSIVGEETLQSLREKIERIKDKHIVFINSTYQGGGVAEMLNSLIPLFNISGLKVGWRIVHGSRDFFTITKKIHNGLQGKEVELSDYEKRIYYETNRRYSLFTHLDHDLVVVHDPQPLAMIKFYEKKQPWIWRMHIDLSNPNRAIWNYVKEFVTHYDEVVISNKSYSIKDFPKPQRIIYPAIDPLSLKNKELSNAEVSSILSKYEIRMDKPIISQVSRFDIWKDPLGVIEVFEEVRKDVDCQLILLGSMASDDPEGFKVLEQVEKRASQSKFREDIHILNVSSDLLVNAVQRGSTVVIQKSKREGFGLVISEALYKRTPVVASNIGGIPLQIKNGYNGFLHDPKDIQGFAKDLIKIIRDKELREELGNNGREFVVKNFLITRLMSDWLDLFHDHLKNK